METIGKPTPNAVGRVITEGPTCRLVHSGTQQQQQQKSVVQRSTGLQVEEVYILTLEHL